jgi:hypothetical protein
MNGHLLSFTKVRRYVRIIAYNSAGNTFLIDY